MPAEEDRVPQVGKLTEADIPDSLLKKSLEAHNVVTLKWWWLLCHGIKFQSITVF